MLSLWKQVSTRALDLLLPPLCVLCDEPVGGVATLCPACWKQIPFIEPPFCACCGMSFDLPVGDGMLCGACLRQTPRFASARAAILYNDVSRNLVLGFKHGDRTHMAKALGAWMHRAAADVVAQADALVPVPLHRWRLFQRRYNQASLLAQQVGALAQKPVLLHALRRTRATSGQGHLRRKERQENVRGAFAVSPPYIHEIEGKTLVLIDDVLTTGATVEECTRVLERAGAKKVHVLTLARVKSVV